MGFRSYPKVYFILILVSATTIMANGLVSSFLSIFAKSLGPVDVLAGLAISAWFLARLFIEFPSGTISNRIGRTRLLMSGLIVSFSGILICAISNSIYLLILGRAIWGIGTALYFMNSTVLVIDLFGHTSMKGSAVGTFQGIEFLGTFIGAPLGAFVADSLNGNFLPVFYMSACLAMFSFLLAFTSKDLRKIGGSIKSKESAHLKEVLFELKNWSILVICISSFTRMFITQGIKSTVFSLYLNQEVKLSIGLIGIILSARVVGHILASLTAGYFSDKIGRRPIIIIGMLIEGVGLYSYTLIPNFELFLPAALLEGLGGGMIFTCLLVLLSEVAPPRTRDGAVGLYRTFMAFGGILGPEILLFTFSDWSPHSPFLFSVMLLMVNAILMVTIKVKKTA